MISKADAPYNPLTVPNLVHILGVKVVIPPVLEVQFDDGVTAQIDFSDIIQRSRWFHALAQPTTFANVAVACDGRALQWAAGADYCADALRMLADEQDHITSRKAS